MSRAPLSSADRREVQAFREFLADPMSKTNPRAAYADHYGEVLFEQSFPDHSPARSGVDQGGPL